MATMTEIAQDIKKEYGAFVSVADLVRYSKCNREWWRKMLVDITPIGTNTGKRYFYKEVAAVIAAYHD